MSTQRTQLKGIIQQGVLADEKIADAAELALPCPPTRDWVHFLDRLLLILGALSLASAVLFFIAYNWDALGRFAKLGGVQLLIIAAIAAYCFSDPMKLSSRLLLVFACICVGVVLGLYGQIYQTGADPWQLFFNWSLLIIPWVVIARLAALWLLWLGLLNLTIGLYFDHGFGAQRLFFFSSTDAAWGLFALNAASLAAWEWFSHGTAAAPRWPCRIVAIGVALPITLLALGWVFGSSVIGLGAILCWLLWLVTLYAVYRMVQLDVFMLAGGCLSGIVVITSWIGHAISDSLSDGGFLLLAVVVIGLGSASANWLRRLSSEITP